jgi:acyl-coenzyme A synthetase/AMP-(fatty) acid ligase
LACLAETLRQAGMIPLLGHHCEDQPVAVFDGRLISASEFMADVHALAERLPSRRYAINLCRDRYCFAVAFAAAMLRNQISLLPSSQSPATLEQLRSEYVSVYVMVDDDGDRSVESVRVKVGNALQSNKLASLAFSDNTVAAIVFTSGSTGTPVANRKTWGALALGGLSEASRFGLIEDTSTVVFGTVPPQHMYGLESTVVMALRGGLIMHNERLFFPADIQHALASVDARRVLVSTPVHLRAILSDAVKLAPLWLTICATAPLTRDMAGEFESQFTTRVHEVYGFTEAGMVATRRTLDGPQWQLLAGLKIRKEHGRFLVSGGHVPDEVAFSDSIELNDDRRFMLQGRHADLVNVAGKRTSIAYLDHQVCAIPGVQDGAFLMPEEAGDKVTRLMACVVAPEMTREQLLGALAERIDPAFLPRPLYLVDALPRNSTGKLPRGDLVSMVRECAASSSNRPAPMLRSVEADHPALAGHFPGDPIVPGVVLLDEITDVIATELGPDYTAGKMTIRSAKFLRPVRPGDKLQIKLTHGAKNAVRFVCKVGMDTVATGLLESGRVEK